MAWKSSLSLLSSDCRTTVPTISVANFNTLLAEMKIYWSFVNQVCHRKSKPPPVVDLQYLAAETQVCK